MDWTLSLSARSGDVVGLTMSFNVSLSSSFQGLVAGTTNKSVAFDSSHTSLLNRLDVTDGYSLSSSSGQLVPHEGAFAYLAVLAATPPVPEPHTCALMLVGLSLVGARSLKRP